MPNAAALTTSKPYGRDMKLRAVNRLRLLLSITATLFFTSFAMAQTGETMCGNPFKSWFGPYDYRAAPKDALSNVETHHFSSDVEQLKRGVTTDVLNLGQDIAYVLGVFPNHHRALLAMMRLSEKDKNDQPRNSGRPIECWFDRAVRFAKDDTVARLMYALWLRKKGRVEESIYQTKTAEADAEDNPLTHYNVGISYFELGQYDQAAAAARRAQELGMARPDLINRLKSINRWTESDQ